MAAKIVKSLVTKLLKAIKVDTLQEKAGITATEGNSFSNVIANVVYGLIILIVVTSALDQLEIAAISGPANEIVATIFAMLPNVLGAIIIVAIGLFAANAAENAIVKKAPNAKGGALTAKVAIYVVTAFMCLSQLGIAGAMVETTFILIIAAVCIAIAIAFGVGGRTFAANTLAKLEKKLDDKEDK